MAIYDTIQFIRPDVATICIGQAASVAALLLASGTPGKRFACPNSRLLIHQPTMGSLSGQATDIDIHAREILRIRASLNEIMAKSPTWRIEYRNANVQGKTSVNTRRSPGSVLEDCATLRLEKPERLARATDNIDAMAAAIRKLEEGGSRIERRLNLLQHREVPGIREAVAQRFQRHSAGRTRGR